MPHAAVQCLMPDCAAIRSKASALLPDGHKHV